MATIYYYITIRTYYLGITADFYTEKDYIFKDKKSFEEWYKKNKIFFCEWRKIVKQGKINFNQDGMLAKKT